MKKFVVSDLHGQYSMFRNLVAGLEKNYANDYKLYIIGDILDRGYGGYNIYKLITSPKFANKIVLLKGNHEKILSTFIRAPLYKNEQDIYDFYLSNRNGTVNTMEGILYNIINDVPTDKIKLKQFPIEKREVCKAILEKQASLFTDACLYNHVKPSKQKMVCLVSELYDRLKEMADYFNNLPTYAIEQGAEKFLLVHSGFVNVPTEEGYRANVKSDFICKSIQDIKYQNENVLLSCRLTNEQTQIDQVPQQRFCDHVIVCGHTSNYNYTNGKTFGTLFNGEKLQSICLDGTAFLRANKNHQCGQINCVCLDDLSQIIVKNDDYKIPEYIMRAEEKE